MTRRKTNKKPIIVLLILLVLATGLLAGLIWFVNTHFFVGGRAYANDAKSLDLRNQILTVQEYEQIRERLPDCAIRWNIPFQNSAYPDDTASLSVRNLTDADVKALAFFEKLEKVDAAGCRDYEQLMELKKQCPDVEVFYTVTVGGQEYPWDAAAVKVSAVSDEEIEMLACLPELRAVDATSCQDEAGLAALTEAFPDLDISYRIELLGQTFTEADVTATFQKPDVQVLLQRLGSLSHLESVHLVEPNASAEELLALTETYPDIAFTWEKTVLGKTFNSSAAEYDFTGSTLITNALMGWGPALDARETAEMTKKVEEAMRYFPNAEKVIIPGYSIDNETMSAFREKMRDQYKVVWTVYLTKKPVRTDSTIIHSSAMKVCFIDEQSQDLKYCEDAVIVDIGHSYVKNIEWVRYMPNLQYLILAHNWLRDITPLSSCKKLVYLEIFWNDYVEDYTPLQGCTSLVDLNISGTYADLEPLKELTWVKNLWANCCGLTESDYQELKAALPDTHIEYRGGDYTTYGWRELQGYYDMRDLMGLPYNHW